MSIIFTIEDESHAEMQGQYSTYEEALNELKRRADIPWDQQPNVCPCMSWKTCGRNYEIIKYDDGFKPWKLLDRKKALAISAKEIKWFINNP